MNGKIYIVHDLSDIVHDLPEIINDLAEIVNGKLYIVHDLRDIVHDVSAIDRVMEGSTIGSAGLGRHGAAG